MTGNVLLFDKVVDMIAVDLTRNSVATKIKTLKFGYSDHKRVLMYVLHQIYEI